MKRNPPGRLWVHGAAIALVLSGWFGSPLRAGDFTCDGGNRIYWFSVPGSSPADNNCQGATGFRCHPPERLSSAVELVNPGCNPRTQACAVRLRVSFEFPGAAQTFHEDGLTVGQIYWFAGATSPSCTGTTPSCGQIGICSAAGQALIYDFVDTYILKNNVTCANAAASQEVFSLTAWACPTISSCRKELKVEGLTLGGPSLAAAIGCPVPPPPPCTEGDGSSSGASGNSCPLCQSVGGGGGCSASAAGGGPGCEPPGLGKAQLRYAAGGVGGDGLPGSTAWRTALGRFWAHDFSERIVVDPNTSHVWFLSRYGSLREYSNLAGGGGLRLYQSHAPSDEFRQLYFDTSTGGWQLHTLDGRQDFFRPDGLWEKTVFAADPAHPILGTYNTGQQLLLVTFQDGRSDSLTYFPDGKLATITENPVAGSGAPSRIWSLTWSGDLLTFATRPDGTAYQFFYDPARPGYLTRMDLVDGPRWRVEAAFEYQPGTNNVARSWRGDPLFNGPNAVDKTTYTYTNPSLPTKSVVTREVSATFNQITTYEIARDTVSLKPKLTSIQGSCPSCGLSPKTAYAYTGSNPLLPSAMTDARNTRTDYLYDTNGRLQTRTEAANVPSLTRTTTFTYDPNFPGQVTRVEVPSTSGGTNKRRTDSAYDPATGVLTARTIDGFEAGAPLPAGFKLTSYSHNGSGEVLTVDPPGFGTADATTFTYNLAGRNGHVPDSRTDPLVGTTLFGYDGLNRRTGLQDPNGVETLTSYDSLNRVTEVRQKGATPADDLVTTYVYSAFGDLACTRLPRGNGLEYLYDPAGRLKEIIRGTALATPTSTACLDPAEPRERTVYQLDGIGNRIEESQERWTGSAWVSNSKTAYEYTCHLDRITHGAGGTTPAVTEYCYDLNSNLEKVWDPNHPRASNPNPTQLYAYDALNRLISVTQPWAGAGGGTAVTSYQYDVQDHLTRVTDAEGNATIYNYSDRDLMTQEVSPASGTTAHAYNEHGELISETDARGIVMTRTVDVLDRVTAVTYPNAALGSAYVYDDPLVSFSKGRLTRISRHGEAVDYRYDRFGRVLQDGSLAYTWDANSNPATILYPGGVKAVYGFDFADRPATLLAQRPSLPDQPLVTGSSYLPAGPLSRLTLGNGLTETRTFDNRYFPSGITLGGLLNWSYSTDAVGNILSITDTLNAANNRTYGYQDNHYFLTQGNGPWGPRSWSYDKIGNRLTETRGAVTDTYSYPPNGAAGRTPILSQIQLGTGGTRTYQFGPAGHLDRTALGADTTLFLNDDAGRLAALERPSTQSGATFRYDGRDYLSLADSEALSFRDGFDSGDVCAWSGAIGLISVPICVIRPAVRATYSSEGLLHSLHRNVPPQSSYVFYFAGRPAAQLDVSNETESWKWLTADHLSTPIAATGAGGALLWQGGFEPFGADWSGAGGAGVFLRLPGQWVEGVWGNAGEGLYYNLHRWYERGTGRYTRPDPLGLVFDPNVYAYTTGRPTFYLDPLSLAKVTNKSCRAIAIKTEGGNNQVRLLKPGESGDADGFFNGAADSCNLFCDAGDADMVYKINTATGVTITGGCGKECLSWETDDLTSFLANTLDPRRVLGRGSGWKGAGWFRDHADWRPPTQTRPKNCCEGPRAPLR